MHKNEIKRLAIVFAYENLNSIINNREYGYRYLDWLVDRDKELDNGELGEFINYVQEIRNIFNPKDKDE